MNYNTWKERIDLAQSLLNKGQHAYLAFNKRIAKQMNKSKNVRKWQKLEREIRGTILSLKKGIQDDDRGIEDTNYPSIQVTFSTNDATDWNFQTGDNSYQGPCYGDKHWSVTYITRKSNCKDIAKEVVCDLSELMLQAQDSVIEKQP